MTMKKTSGVLLALLVALVYLMPGEVEEPGASATVYCEMRALHAATNGEFGWPRHNEGAEKECEGVAK